MLNKSTKFLVKGGKPLHGTITLSGAKNAASKEIIASMLTNEPVHFTNCPISISEISITKEICETLGSKFQKFENNEVIIETKNIHASSFSASLGIINRIGILTVGPLLKRAGEAKIPKLGGDKIGARPIDFHLNGLIQMGATIKEYKDFYYLKCKLLRG
ncbi:MAG: UDP-N-acetylglucosamine 1-carboxyvinyltransferase, partial [Saprospiraceae bacterium]